MGTARSENEEREQRILDAALDLIVHYGYDKTTVSDIAQAAGVSKGAIYLHFTSKDELFEALLLREIQSYSAHWFDLIERDPLGGTMAGIYKNVLYAMHASPFIMALFKQDRRILGSYLRKPNNLYSSGSYGLRAQFIKVMQEAGAVRPDVDPKVIGHVMNMLAYGLVSMDEIMDEDEIPPLDDVIEGIADLMGRALQPEDTPEEVTSEAGKAALRQIRTAAEQAIEDYQTKKEDTQ